MYACQIVKLMENDPVMKLQFAGVYARDTLPQCPADKKSVYIVNSDVSTSVGKHWLCIYCILNFFTLMVGIQIIMVNL